MKELYHKPEKYLVLSFDDGTVYDERFIEILNKYRIPATFNLNSGLNDFVWYCGEHPIRRLKLWEKTAIYEGHEVASHTLTHPCLTALSEEELIYQINSDVAELERMFGREITSFAVPFDACGEREIGIIREKTGIQYIRLSVLKEKGDFAPPADPYHFEVNALYQDRDIFEQISRFAENELERSVFIIAGHSYEFELNDHWRYIEELIRYIASFDAFQVVTFSKAAKELWRDR